MKQTFVAGSITLLLFSSAASGQDRSQTASATMGVPLPFPGPVEVEIREQPGSPLKLFVDENLRGRLSSGGAPVTARNEIGPAIAAFVLRYDVNPDVASNILFVGPKGLGVGENRIHGLTLPRGPDGRASKAVLSVDYVQFVDGKTWGEDSLGRGKQVVTYLEGRKLALSRLEQLLIGQDDIEYRRVIDIFGSVTFGEPILATGRAQIPLQSWHTRGYQGVLNILRDRVRQNPDAAKELARKLEVLAIQ